MEKERKGGGGWENEEEEEIIRNEEPEDEKEDVAARGRDWQKEQVGRLVKSIQREREDKGIRDERGLGRAEGQIEITCDSETER